MKNLARDFLRALLPLSVMEQTGATHTHVDLVDLSGSGPIVSAVQWLQGTLMTSSGLPL